MTDPDWIDFKFVQRGWPVEYTVRVPRGWAAMLMPLELFAEALRVVVYELRQARVW